MDNYHIHKPPHSVYASPPEYSAGQLFTTSALPYQPDVKSLPIPAIVDDDQKKKDGATYIKGLFAGATIFTLLEIGRYLLFGF